MGQHLLRGSHLDNFSVVHKDDDVGQIQSLLHIVGDKDEGFVQLLLERAYLLLEGPAGHGIQGGEGLVHEYDGGRGRQRPQDADALLLSAGHFRGVFMGVLLIGHVDQLQQRVDNLVTLLLAVFQQGGHHADVLGHRHIGKQADLLDHIADMAAQFHLVLGGDVLLVEVDLARRGLDEAVDHLQRGGLTAAGRPDQDSHLALLDLEGQVVQNLLAAVGQRYVFKTKQ